MHRALTKILSQNPKLTETMTFLQASAILEEEEVETKVLLDQQIKYHSKVTGQQAYGIVLDKTKKAGITTLTLLRSDPKAKNYKERIEDVGISQVIFSDERR